MTLLEAAACGRPLIATDLPGCREVVIPDLTGLLVPPDDPAALAAAIEKLAAAPELCERLGANARKLVADKFSADAVGRATVDLYRRLIAPMPQRAG
jgi:glycosyltransferase involved in cell wall biosynthesis